MDFSQNFADDLAVTEMLAGLAVSRGFWEPAPFLRLTSG
jgi:hypothetical protein